MMANAARDPLWQAKVGSEVLRNTQLGEVIQERCSRCHMPMAHEVARINRVQISMFGGGFLDRSNPLHSLAMDGVSCSLCHQVLAASLGTEESFTGNFKVDENSPTPVRMLFGPYASPFAMAMRMMSGFTPRYGLQISSSEMCGTCHTVYVPVVDAGGKVVARSPEQTPYLEWKHSSFGDRQTARYKTCQGCHMPDAEGGVVISTMPRRLRARSPFRTHTFTGANAFIPGIAGGLRGDPGTRASGPQFDKATSRTTEQLGNHSGGIEIVSFRNKGDTLEIKVRVVNKTGHKLPTGIPLRRVWIHLVVTDQAGDVVFESGKPNGDGSIEGNAADTDLLSFEPHFNVIDSPAKVQIYEAIERDTDGAVTYVFLRGDQHIKDNRLLPVGFDKASAPDDVRPHGESFGDPDFIGGSDIVTYVVRPTKKHEPFSVKVEFLYQAMSFAAAKDLAGLAGKDSLIDRFVRSYERADKTPIVISSASASEAR